MTIDATQLYPGKAPGARGSFPARGRAAIASLSSLPSRALSRTWAVVAAGCLGCVATAGGPAADKPRTDSESVKVEVDAVTRATPRALRAPLEITRISTYHALTFDPAREASGRLSYTLSKPAWIRIRLVARSDPRLVLRTLVDWSPRELGENFEEWDGRDASGHWLDRRRCPGLFVIEGDSPEHEAHERERCGDPMLTVVSPEDGDVVGGVVSVTVRYGTGPRGYLKLAGGTLRIHVDCVPAGERRYDPGSSGSFEWLWDTGQVAEGRHTVTVNLDDGYDHLGTASVEVLVNRPDSK